MAETDSFSISAFITNLGKYNEGELLGEWVDFPADKDSFQQMLRRIGIGSFDEFGHPYEEIFISDYECSCHAIRSLLSEYESVSRLNYLSVRISELDLFQQEKYLAILESGCDSFSSIDALIDLSFNLECYDYRPDINDEYDLGYDQMIRSGFYQGSELKELTPYIDFESIGRDLMINDSGAFSENGYVRRNCESWIVRFSGSPDEIPKGYRLY